MARHLETAFGKGERYMDQETRLDARRGDRRGDNRSGRAALNGCPHSLVRWQFERDGEVAQMQTVNLERGLKLGARSGPDLTNDPLALGKIRGGDVFPVHPGMVGRDDEY